MAADNTPLVYAAHPMTTYGTLREARALARLAELAPYAQIIDPATRYRDTAHWQDDWPRLLPRLAALIVFGDKRGAIGTGCLQELAGAWWLGVPVAMMDEAGACRHLAGIRIFSERIRTPSHTAALVPGRIVALAVKS